MTDSIFLDWFKAVFPAPLLNLPYPAIRYKGATYIFSMMSDLDTLREMVKAKPPEVPLIPVIAIDCPMPSDPPRNEWIGITAKDLHWYEASVKKEGFAPPIEAFNETISAMTKLYGNNHHQ